VNATVPARKVKIEFFDHSGTRHTITVDGAVTKEKIAKILDYVELMGDLPTPVGGGSPKAEKKFERLRDLLSEFQGRSFRSEDMKQAYEQRYGENIALSTVCTYLSRFADRGAVLRSGSSAQWLYTIKPPGTFSWNNIIQK
jgi:hypothetical protein